QHVGDDLLVDRHERSSLCQFLELFERRYMHMLFGLCQTPSRVFTGKGSAPFTELHTALVPARRRRAAASITPGSGFLPVHHSNCLSAWATSIARPSSVARTARRAVRAGVRSPGYVGGAVPEPAGQPARRHRRFRTPRDTTERRTVDQQV